MRKIKDFFDRNITFVFRGNIYLMLIWRLAVVMLLNTVCRILFYAFNAGFYPDMTFGHFMSLLGGGVRFDALGLFYVNSIYILGMLIPFRFRYNNIYQTVLKWLFFVTNSIALAANCVDIIYFRFTMRRTTATVFREFGNDGTTLFKLFADFFVQYWYLTLIFAALVAIMVLSYGKVRKPEIKSLWFYYPIATVLMIVGAFICLGAARGSFSPFNRPLALSNASEYARTPIEMPLVQSTPTAIFRTMAHSSQREYVYYDSEDELNAIYTPEKEYHPADEFRPKNVVILILESFGAEYIAAYNQGMPDYRSYTPNLDTLMQRSRYYLYSFANGRKSIDAMPSILAGIPSIGEPYVLSPYSSNHINGIASVLREKGYHTAFFHGAPNGSMGFNGIARLTGFEEYYGMTEFDDNTHFDRTGGIFDEEFFQYYAETMNTLPEPFCTAMFSLSSHTPFTLPERYKDVYTEGPSPFHKVLSYSDYSLGRFFETVSKMPWFENTLFVLSADHGGTYRFVDKYKTTAGVFAIPIVLYAPGDPELHGCVDGLAQQVDILPTVLSYLNYDGRFVSFGNNLLEANDDYFVANYIGGVQLFWNDYVMYFDGETATALYRFKEDTLLENNLIGTLPEVESVMLPKAKAFLQQYTTRLICDRFAIRE